jgi:type IV secretory pathway VirJ component
LPIEVGDLPLIELPARQSGRDRFAIMLSGDGGWAGLDKEVAAELNARGVAVVGWDSLRYFWSARTPDEAASDLNRVIQHYARSWAKSQVLLVGYSQGADVMPFMVNRLPAATRRMIASTALVGIGAEAFFEFSVSHWISTPTGGMPVSPEINRGLLGRFSCIYGADEENSPCLTIGGKGLRRIALPGGHHFAGDYARVAGAVLDGLPP